MYLYKVFSLNDVKTGIIGRFTLLNTVIIGHTDTWHMASLWPYLRLGVWPICRFYYISVFYYKFVKITANAWFYEERIETLFIKRKSDTREMGHWVWVVFKLTKMTENTVFVK